MGNVWAADKMLGIPVAGGLVDHKEDCLEQSRISSEAILKAYPQSRAVANTFRFDHGQGIRYYTTLYTDGQLFVSKEYVAEQIVGKVGSGDCFMAGLIYGFYKKLAPQQILDFATEAAFAKLFTESDFNTNTIQDIKKVVQEYED